MSKSGEGFQRADTWLASRSGIRLDRFVKVLTRGVPGTPRIDVVDVSPAGSTMRMTVTGRVGPDPDPLWALPVTFIPEDGAAEESSIHVRRSAAPAATGKLLLRNLVRACRILGLGHINASLSTNRSYAYARAGFLPSVQSWPILRGRLLRALDGIEPTVSGRTMITDALGAPEPTALRALLPERKASQMPAPGTLYPEACRAVLTHRDVFWEGRLDLHDVISRRLLGCYVSR